MNNNIRRFAAALSLTLVLATTPAFAGPSRDRGSAPERPGIVRVIQKLLRIFGVKPMADPVIPLPGPNANGE